MTGFPQIRMRRLRRTEPLRALIRETSVDVGDLVYPLFVVEGDGQKQEIASMPGISRFSVDLLAKEAEEVAKLGIPAVILFGILGLLMKRYNFSRPAFILGFVLGLLAEIYILRSIKIYGLLFFTTPISLVIIAIIAGLFFYPVLKKVWSRPKEA